MAVGGQAQLTTGAVDAQIRALVGNVDNALEACVQFNTWVGGAGGGAAGLVLIPAGGGRSSIYAAADATSIINMFADLNKLRQVAHGQNFGVAAPGVAAVLQDFFVNARLGGDTQMP